MTDAHCRAVELLASCLLFVEDQVSQHLPKLLPALCQVCFATESAVEFMSQQDHEEELYQFLPAGKAEQFCTGSGSEEIDAGEPYQMSMMSC